MTMVNLDEGALAGVKNVTRERKLTSSERLAIFAFRHRGVPIKVIARTFGVSANAVRYITNYAHTAAYAVVKSAFEEIGEDRIWSEVVTPAQTESINEGMRKMFEGKKLNDSGYRGINRGRARARRARAAAKLPQAASDDSSGGSQAN